MPNGERYNALDYEADSSDEEQVKRMRSNLKNHMASQEPQENEFSAVDFQMDNIDEDDE